MEPRLALGLLLAPALAGCLASPAAIESADLPEVPWLPRLWDGFIHEYADVEAEPGLLVHLDVWRPDPATYRGEGSAEGPFPVIVDAGPYFGPGKQGADRRMGHYVHTYMFEHMIPRGYAFAAVENAGSAGSTGCWDFMGPREVAGNAAAVEWLASQPWSSGKVGMIGKSYDAMTQVMAASRAPQGLATIVPVAPLTHAYAGIYMNGVPYVGFWGGAAAAYSVDFGVADIPVHTPERVPNALRRAPQTAECAPDNVQGGLLNGGDYNVYYQQRDFRPSAAQLDIPVFFMQGFLDRNVHADNAFPYVNDITAPKQVWLGQWYHDYANATFAGRDDMYIALTRWFDRWLKGVPNGVERDLGVHVQDSEGRWRREAAWPSPAAQPLTFALADRALAAPGTAGAGRTFLDDTNVYWNVGHRPVDDPMPGYLTYAAEALDRDVHIAGPAALSLNVSSSGPRGQVIAELVDCDAPMGSDCHLVSIGAMNLRHRHGLERGEDLAQGEVASVRFELQPRDYVLKAGRVLLLVIAGTDEGMFQVEPTRNLITVHEGADRGSTLELPVLEGPVEPYLVGCGIRIRDRDCFQDGLKDRYPEA